MGSLQFGLSGCGRRGAEIVRLVRDQGDCRIAAVHDPDPDALAQVGELAGVARRTTDFGAMLATGVDFVVLAGPCGAHREQVEAAAAQGAHCLVHAPMAPDAASAAAMVAACDRAGVKLGVAVPEQADPIVEQLRRMVADDWLGAPVLLAATHADDGALQSPPPPDHWLRDPAHGAGNALLQLASADLHLLLWLCGRTPLQVAAQGQAGLGALPQDSAVATLVLRGGALCTLAASHLARGQSLQVLGTDGALRFAADRLWLRGRKQWRGELFDYPEPGVEVTLSAGELAAVRGPHAARHELHGRFARWIDDCDDFPCPGDQAAADLAAFDAIARALVSAQIEPVPPRGP